MFVFTNRNGQPYTEQGFKALWSKIMADWVTVPGRERFTFHDLRACYVTVMGRDENPETHANPATTRRVYDRRRVVKIKAAPDTCHHRRILPPFRNEKRHPAFA